MTQTITRLFDTRAQAETAVQELEEMGVSNDAISIVAHGGERAADERRSFGHDHDDTAEGAGKGAGAGAVVGGAGGLLAGLGLLAIPGIGPVVAGGWLVATLVGAAGGAVVGGAAGGLLGALKDAGVNEDDAHVYAENIRRGGALVSVRAEDADAPRIEQSLNSALGVDAASRRSLYNQDGWTRFDETAAPYNAGTGAPLL